MNKVIVGKIVNTCGLKGEVKVINSSDFTKERYKKDNVLFAVNEDKNINKTLTVSSYRENNKFVYLKFKEINSIEEAEILKESYLIIDGEQLDQIDADTFYHYELLNTEVYVNDEKIGSVAEISDNGVQDLLRVIGENVNFLIPFVDEFIEKIDVKNKKIYLKNIEGLL
jgi:16S rRNA processing protein RimM